MIDLEKLKADADESSIDNVCDAIKLLALVLKKRYG